MSNIPQSDIAEIKRTLADIGRSIHRLEIANMRQADRLDNIERSLPLQIESGVRDYMRTNATQSREVSNWVISLASVILFALFGTITAVIQIWGG